MLVLIALFCVFGVQSALAANSTGVQAGQVGPQHLKAAASALVKEQAVKATLANADIAGVLADASTKIGSIKRGPLKPAVPAVTSPASGAATPVSSGPTGVTGNWNMIFDDEFSSNTPDPTKWNPNWYGTSSTQPSASQSSTDQSCLSPSELNESGGALSLGVSTTPCTADNGTQYANTGSLINTWNKFQFTYGFMEARIYVPTSPSGQLVNSLSFWADGTGSWPSTGELDVMELLNGCGPNNSGPGFAYHFHDNSGGPGACGPQADNTGGWHTFGANWQPGKVTYYYDGQNIGSITQGITSSPMYLILSQSVNTTWASHTVQNAQAKVDYVRVWQQAS